MVLDRSWERMGVYLRAKLIVMAIVGSLTYGSVLRSGCPSQSARARRRVRQLIPASAPGSRACRFFSIAALEGPRALILTFVASIVIQNAKGYVISPVVEGDQLDIHPLLVFLGVLVGASLAGPAGAFVAVPAVAVLDIVIREVVVPWRHEQLSQDEEEAGPLGSTLRRAPGHRPQHADRRAAEARCSADRQRRSGTALALAGDHPGEVLEELPGDVRMSFANLRKSQNAITWHRSRVTAVTVAARASPERSASSPKWPPGPMRATSSPSTLTDASPSATMKKPTPLIVLP